MQKTCDWHPIFQRSFYAGLECGDANTHSNCVNMRKVINSWRVACSDLPRILYVSSPPTPAPPGAAAASLRATALLCLAPHAHIKLLLADSVSDPLRHSLFYSTQNLQAYFTSI